MSNGKAFDINWMGATNRFGNKLMIELVDNRALSKIAANFEGVDTITKTDSKKPNVKEVYEGYTKLVGMSKENAEGVIRLTLEKGD
jgi:hypothetical protein